MHPLDDSELTPDDRRRELAQILARGILRLQARAALPTVPICENPANPATSGLEVEPKTRLSVYRG